MNDEDRKYCKQIIESFLVESFEDECRFQADDGWASCIQAIPILIQLYPQELDSYTKSLLFALYNQESYEYAVAAINRLWQIYPDDMLRLVCRFIKTKVLYYTYEQENQSRLEILRRIDQELSDINTDINNLDVDIVYTLQLHDLEVLLSLMSGHSVQPVFQVIAEKIMQIASRLLINEDDRFDPANPSIYKRCADYILTSEDVPIENLLRPFMENLRNSRDGEIMGVFPKSFAIFSYSHKLSLRSYHCLTFWYSPAKRYSSIILSLYLTSLIDSMGVYNMCQMFQNRERS